MSDNHYQCSIHTPLKIEQVYRAITQEMSQWWTLMSAAIDAEGDQITAQFEDGTTWSFDVVTLVENKLIELYCSDANHIHPVTTPMMRTEWKGTRLHFQLKECSNGTDIEFTHIGLVPDFHCYEICCAGWDHFFGTAFKQYLEAKIV